jgi:cytochrome c peroxidase
VGWTGDVGGNNVTGGIYRGAIPQRFGNRKPPTSAYATQAELFSYEPDEGHFEGGNFWDGRATGHQLGNPAADQALGPFLNPVEQNNPSKRAVLEQIAKSKYANLWTQVWGAPVRLGSASEINEDYDRVGLSIAAYEASPEVIAFSSKFDCYERGEVDLTPLEEQGKDLFEGKATCAACHPAPLSTDYTYDNLGAPKDPRNPFYGMDRVFLDDGSPINPQGGAWIDPGLGGSLASLPESWFTELGLNKADAVAENMGKFKVPTLRNVDLRPDPTFPKAYLHNGVFKSLKEVVHFYNTRDVEPWPAPEVAENINVDELGNLGLTDAEEDAIVAFMAALSDGYVPELPRMMAAHEATVTAATPLLAVRAVAPGLYRVAFRLPAETGVQVTVYDVTGRRIQTLVGGTLGAGDHAVDWSAQALPRGLYFVSLKAGETQISNKVLVTR